MAIVDLDHVNIRTTQLAKTTAFFTEVLGLVVGWRPDFPFGGAWLYAGEKDVVHLVEVAKAHVPSEGSSLDHFAFATTLRTRAGGWTPRGLGIGRAPRRTAAFASFS